MAFLDEILRSLQGQQQGPSLNVNTAIPQPAPILQTQPNAPQVATPEVKNADGGILGTLGLLSSVLKGDIGGAIGQLENRKIAQQTQRDKQKKAQTEANLGRLTSAAIGVKPSEMKSPEDLYSTLLQSGASPDDARSTLNFIQSQQESQAKNEGRQAFAPAVQALLPQVANQELRNALGIQAGINPEHALNALQTELGRQTAAGERDLRKQEKSITTKTEAAKQTLKNLGPLAAEDQALKILSTKIQGKGAAPLTIGDVFAVSLDDKDSVKEFADKYGMKAEDAKLAISNLQKAQQSRAPGTFEFFSDKNKLQLSPVDIEQSIQAAGSPEAVQALQEAKATITEGAQKKAEVRAYEPKSKKEKEVFKKTKANAPLMSPEARAKRLQELEALGKK
jgi:hypothetical protein